MVQIWPGQFVCKQVGYSPGHIWTTLYKEAYDINSWVGIVTRLRTGRRGFRFMGRTRGFPLQIVQSASGTQKDSLSQRTKILSPEVKRPVLDINHWPLSGAEVKKVWSYTPLPQSRSCQRFKIRSNCESYCALLDLRDGVLLFLFPSVRWNVLHPSSV